MTFEELKSEMQSAMDRRVYVTGAHPHAGETGQTVKLDLIHGKPAILVKGDDGEDFYVFSPAELKFL